ncbi:SPE2-interacting protein, putative [Plasmodium knowlesi strain H]|uniref:Transcription factor with AP2 domain(S), putative n=3 Tax=Plasmodium knowlesi TaxID=5850 RepID=A0A5K1VT05_PLAKH|nr:AP2 domain transcription factor, putative [Plasmodium knowlesi strain H]OTN64726.1 putative Transcription factor with AP2 domain(S) [Plasmodium knowlesi]CAA9989291.1 AP2 domain transcription factor, putative [Plasmodium knowlesi strain H]SBO26133.1 SPE2-interacting protein, putative [Plasmodium knowlesi strain H]SBO26810.1 SPE2-interacting protein, putative [Plasmodium knowlesi strain H]VVS78765.1 AP2 domain transcription factor, putative [Plasmodium knowlesi strain H]|eukprot:XP_002261637.1 hypothetical protein, conserved in Plasmodium species [Plasmodium knowlesi strain H]
MQSVVLESDPVGTIEGALSEDSCQGGIHVNGDVSGDVCSPSVGGCVDAPACESPNQEITHNDEASRCKEVNIKSEPVIVIDKVERCLVVEWYENDIRREQRISYKKYGNDKAKLRAKELIEKLKAGITFEQLYPDKGPPIVRVYQDVGVYRVSLIRDRIEREWRVEWTDNDTPMKARWSCKKVGNDEAQKRAETFAQSLIEGVFNPILLHKATGTRFSRSDRTVVKINVYMKKNVKRKNKCKVIRGGDNSSLILGKGIKNELRKGKMKRSGDTVDGSLMEGSNMVHRNQAYSGSTLSNIFIKSESSTLDGRTDSNYVRSIEGEDAHVALPEQSYLLSEYHVEENPKQGGGINEKKRNYKSRGNGSKGERIKKTPKDGSKLKRKMARRVKDTMRGVMGDSAEEGVTDQYRDSQMDGTNNLNLLSCYAEMGNVDVAAFSSNSNQVKNEPGICDPLCIPYSDNGGVMLNCRNGSVEPGAMMNNYVVPCEQYEGYRMGSFMAKGGDYSSRYVYATKSNSYAVYVNGGMEHGALCYGGDVHRGDMPHSNVHSFHYGGEDPFGRSHTIRNEHVPGGSPLPVGHCTNGAVLRAEGYNPYMMSYTGGGMASHMGIMRRAVDMEAVHRDDPNHGVLRDTVGDSHGYSVLPHKINLKNKKPVRDRICHLKKIKCEEDGNDVEGKDPHNGGEKNKETKCLSLGGNDINTVNGDGNGVDDPLPDSYNAERKKRKRSTNKNFRGGDFLLDEELSKYFSTHNNIQLRKNQKALRNDPDGVASHVGDESMGVRRGRRYSSITSDIHGGSAHLRTVNQEGSKERQGSAYGCRDVVPIVRRSNSVEMNENDNALMESSMVEVEIAGQKILTAEPSSKPRRRTKRSKISGANQSALNMVDTIGQRENSVHYGDRNDMRTSYRRYRAHGKRDDSACGGFGSYPMSNLGGMLICNSGFPSQWSRNNDGRNGDVLNGNAGGDSSARGFHPSTLNFRAEPHAENPGIVIAKYHENVGVHGGVKIRENVGAVVRTNDRADGGGEPVHFSPTDMAEGKTHLMNLRKTRRRITPVSSDQPSEIHRKNDNLNLSLRGSSTIEFVENPRGYRVPYEYESRLFYEHFEVPLNSEKEFELQQRYFARLFSLHILAVGWNANKNARVEDYMQELSDPAFQFLTMGDMNNCSDAPCGDPSPPSEENRPIGNMEGKLDKLNGSELQNGQFITSNRLTIEQMGTDHCYFNSVGDGTSRVIEDGSGLNVAPDDAHHLISSEEKINGALSPGEVCDVEEGLNTYRMNDCYAASNVRRLDELEEGNHMGAPSGDQEVGDMSKYGHTHLMGNLNDGHHFGGFAVFGDMLNGNVPGGINGYAYPDGISGLGGPYRTCMMSNMNVAGGVDYRLGNYQGSNDVGSVNGKEGAGCLSGEGKNQNGLCVSSGEGMNLGVANEEGLILRNLSYSKGLNPTHLHGKDIVSQNMHRAVSMPYDQEGKYLQVNEPFDKNVGGNFEYVQNYMQKINPLSININNVDEGSYELPLGGGSTLPFQEMTMVSGTPWEGRQDNEATFGALNTEKVNHYKGFIDRTGHVPMVPSKGEEENYSNLQNSIRKTTELDALAACGREDNSYGVGIAQYDLALIEGEEAQSQRMGYMNSPYGRGHDGINEERLDSGVMEKNVNVTRDSDYLYYNGYANEGMHKCTEEDNYNIVDKLNDDVSSSNIQGNGDFSIHEKVNYQFGHMVKMLPSYEHLEREGSCVDNVVDREAQSQFDNAHYRFGVCSGDANPSIGDVVTGKERTDELSEKDNRCDHHSGNQNTTPSSYDDVAYGSEVRKNNLTSTSISTPMTNMKDMNNYEYFDSRKMVDKLRFTSNSSTINTEYLPSNLLNSISMNNLCPSNNINEQVQK